MIKLENILKSIPNQEIVESHLGQWEYPGRITKIPSNQITMQNWKQIGSGIRNETIEEKFQRGPWQSMQNEGFIFRKLDV